MRGRRLSVLLAVEAAALSTLCATAQADGRRGPSAAPDGPASVQLRVVPALPDQEATAENDSESNISGDISNGSHSSSHTRSRGRSRHVHHASHPGRPLRPVIHSNAGGHPSRPQVHRGHGRTGHGFLPFTGADVAATVAAGGGVVLLGTALVWLTRRRRRQAR